MKKDLIFIFGGGTMSGIFGGGVATLLQKLDLYDRIDSLYASSAGAHSAAYLLARETQFGSSIYLKDLLGSRFIKREKKFQFIYKLLLSFIKKNTKLEKLVDIDYLMDLEKNKRRLNTEKISQSDINLFIRSFNLEEGKIEYLDGKKDTLKKLQATSAVVPFYPRVVTIHHQSYSDGDTLSSIIDPFLEKVIAENRDKTIFLVLNSPRRDKLSLPLIINNSLWTALLFFYFKKKFVFQKLKIFSETSKFKQYSRYPNVKIIQPDYNILPYCTDRQKLIAFYRHGMEKARESLVGNKIISKAEAMGVK
jgi:predicted patatin/cPLA2 family phospholipase